MDVLTGTSGKSAMEVAKEVSSKAGELLARRFPETKEIMAKGVDDIVTDVDKEAEELILSTLHQEFPDMGLLGEESLGPDPTSGYVWIVDPIDGTFNYAWGIPFFSVVVGLAHDGEVIVGVNYDPLRKEMFHAERGRGAFLNDKPIHVSERTTIKGSLLGMDFSYNDDGTVNGLNVMTSIWPGFRAGRIMGSSALGISYAAAGRIDLYFHNGAEPWDQVAGMLLVEEAGGIITDRNGKRADLHSDGLVASNTTLHAEFMRKTDGMEWRMPTHRLV